MAKIPGKNGPIEVSRWQVLGDHRDAEQVNDAELKYLHNLGIDGTSKTIKNLSIYDKYMILVGLAQNISSDCERVCATGVSFAPDFLKFKEKNNVMKILPDVSRINVNAEFTLEGTVRGSGTEDLILRLTALASGRDLYSIFHSKGFIKFSPACDADAMTVQINEIDLGSLSLLLGLISPPSKTRPAIYIGMDVARHLEPYGLIIHRLNKASAILRTFNIYTINIDTIKDLKISEAQTGSSLKELNGFVRKGEVKADALQRFAQNFAEHI
jgi:hypothetical protein